MATRLAIRIQECLDELTPSERKLATYIVEHQHEIVGLSAGELARVAGTSKATTARFFRTLGYESFEAVRLQARSELNRLQPALRSAAAPAEVRAGTPQAYLAEEQLALTRSLEGLNSDTLRAVAERLAAAERVWVLAADEDAPLAPLAQTLLLAARGNVNLLADGLAPLTVRLASVSPRDVLLLIALAPRPAEVRFAVEQVLAAGATMVVMMGQDGARPVGGDLVIRCHARIGPEGASVTAAVSLIQLVARRLATRLGSRAESRRALLDGLREAARNRG